MKKLFVCLSILSLALVSCSKDIAEDENNTPVSGVISGEITGNVNYAYGNYTLQGVVRVKNGATLTIAAGSTIRIDKTLATDNGLIVENGGTINLVGTADAPIVFTEVSKVPGSWSGIMLVGVSCHCMTTLPVTKNAFERLIGQIEDMTEKNKISRISGLIYLGVVLTGIFSLMYVPSKLINYENASITFQNITNSETLFRLGILSGLLCYGFFLFLPIVLYKLLREVNEDMAKMMVLLAIISIPMYFLNIQNEFTALSLIKTPDYLKSFSAEQIQSQVLFYIDQYDDGMRLIHVFSGLWLFPFGYLVFKSNYLPKIFGILLIFGCFGYLINFLGYVLIPNYSALGISSYISLPASIGEMGICLWLIIVGAKEKSAS